MKKPVLVTQTAASLERTRLSPGLRTETVLHRTAFHKGLQQVHRERRVAHHRRLMAPAAVAGQLELQWLGGDRVEPSERPVLTAEPRLNLLHQMHSALVLAPHQMTLGSRFKDGRLGLAVPADQSRAVHIKRK